MIEITNEIENNLQNLIQSFFTDVLEKLSIEIYEIIQRNNVLQKSNGNGFYYKNSYHFNNFVDSSIPKGIPKPLHLSLHKEYDKIYSKKRKIEFSYSQSINFIRSARNKLKYIDQLYCLMPKFIIKKLNYNSLIEIKPEEVLKNYPALLQEHKVFLNNVKLYYAYQLIN